MKYAFFGTPDLCIPLLEKLASKSLLPSVVVTAPDRPVGRKQIITPPPVKVWALEHAIPVLQPEKLDEAFEETITPYQCELFVVVAYGMIIPKNIIELPPYGTLNVHYSLLPCYRGASPVEAAILAGETETGVCIQSMRYKLDSGPVLAEESLAIYENETAPELRDRLNKCAATMLPDVMKAWVAGDIVPCEQDETRASFCRKITRSDGEVTLDMDPSELARKYRAYYGWPGIFFFDADGKRIKITEARPGDHEFRIVRVIPEGKREMAYEDYLRG